VSRRLLPLAVLLPLPLAGCARGPSGPTPGVPSWTLRFVVDFGAPIDDRFFYFIALDVDSDYGVDGPLPVAAGPYWGNGWGTGSITHFISYHQGRYDVYVANRQLEAASLGGGIVAASGSPTETDTGEYELRVGALTLGAAVLSGTGTISGVQNGSDQNAGEFSVETDARGKTVPGQVSFAAAADGGRTPNAAEQAALDALNAGAALTANSLAAFGLTLTLGSPTPAVQTLQVAPAVAGVDVTFRPSNGPARTGAGTLTANSSTPTATPPIPGASVRAETLVPGGTARFRSETAPAATLLGPPYDAQPPLGGSTLDVTLDLDMLGQGVNNLSVNFISTTELIFDPTMTNPGLHTYDGLGPQGNDYVTFGLQQNRTILDRDLSRAGGDLTLQGPATPEEKDAVDILDWQIVVARLSG